MHLCVSWYIEKRFRFRRYICNDNPHIYISISSYLHIDPYIIWIYTVGFSTLGILPSWPWPPSQDSVPHVVRRGHNNSPLLRPRKKPMGPNNNYPINVETNLRISAGSFAESSRYRGESRVGDAQGGSRGQDWTIDLYHLPPCLIVSVLGMKNYPLIWGIISLSIIWIPTVDGNQKSGKKLTSWGIGSWNPIIL